MKFDLYTEEEDEHQNQGQQQEKKILQVGEIALVVVGQEKEEQG